MKLGYLANVMNDVVAFVSSVVIEGLRGGLVAGVGGTAGSAVLAPDLVIGAEGGVAFEWNVCLGDALCWLAAGHSAAALVREVSLVTGRRVHLSFAHKVVT